MSKAGKKLIKAAEQAVVAAKCDHDCEEEHDPRAPWGFETVRCKKCGTKFHIPKGEAF